MKPEFAALMLGLYALIVVPILVYGRAWVSRRVGLQGYILLLGFSVTFIVPAACWVLGVSWPLNDSNSPILRGTGGYYGLDYKYFPSALAIYLVIPLLAIIGTFIIPPRRGAYIDRDVIGELYGQLQIRRVALIALFGAIVTSGLFFQLTGWDRFWASDMGRFEYGQVARGELSMKFALTFALAFGCVGAGSALFKGQFWIATLTVAIAALPYFAFASRGMTILFSAYGAVVFCRLHRRYRLLVIIPLLIGFYYSLRLPLVMRAKNQTGVSIAVQTLFEPEAGNDALKDRVAACLQNIGQGFGLMVEERSAESSSGRITVGIPIQYFILSLSPTISMIDGFSERWVDYSPQQNAFTPFSSLCETVSLNWAFGIMLPVIVYLCGAFLCQNRVGRSLWGDTALFGFVLVMSLGFLQMQQYPLRTVTRFFYSAFILYLCCHYAGLAATVVFTARPMAKIKRALVRPAPQTPRERLRSKIQAEL